MDNKENQQVIYFSYVDKKIVNVVKKRNIRLYCGRNKSTNQENEIFPSYHDG